MNDIIIAGAADITYVDDKKGIEFIKNNGLKFEESQMGKDMRVFDFRCNLVVINSVLYGKQDENIKKACVKLDGSDCYLHVLGFDENTMKNVKITKDDKTKGKYKVVLPNLPWREGSEFDEE